MLQLFKGRFLKTNQMSTKIIGFWIYENQIPNNWPQSVKSNINQTCNQCKHTENATKPKMHPMPGGQWNWCRAGGPVREDPIIGGQNQSLNARWRVGRRVAECLKFSICAGFYSKGSSGFCIDLTRCMTWSGSEFIFRSCQGSNWTDSSHLRYSLFGVERFTKCSMFSFLYSVFELVVSSFQLKHE